MLSVATSRDGAAVDNTAFEHTVLATALAVCFTLVIQEFVGLFVARLEDISMPAGTDIEVDGLRGHVVFSSLSASYTQEFPETDWPKSEYSGIMMRMSNGSLVFHETNILLSDDCIVELISEV